jgi:hypothetical protein
LLHRRLASGGADTTVLIWDLRQLTARLRSPFEGLVLCDINAG